MSRSVNIRDLTSRVHDHCDIIREDNYFEKDIKRIIRRR